MTTKLNLNQSPYFDDYDQTKKYHQILFRPGRAVQARELTQLQTILQQQIERFGTHIFKQGANVIPGTSNSVRFVRDIPFIKIARDSQKYTDAQLDKTAEEIIDVYWLNQTITCTTIGREGISAKIIGYRLDSTEVRFFLAPLSASQNGDANLFLKNDTLIRQETLGTSDGTSNILSLQIPNESSKVGLVSAVTVQEGVYFYNGFFIYVDNQTIFLTPSNQFSPDSVENQSLWNNLPTATVGLSITESIKTYQLNSDLLDNATGTSNQSAPGADRLHIDARLVQMPYKIGAETPSNFIKLLDVVAGEVRFIVNKTDYNILEDTLARRTFDESGDYALNDFVVHIKNFLRDEETGQDGAHDITQFQFATESGAKEFSIEKFKHLLSSTQIENDGVAVEHPLNSNIWYPGTTYDSPGDKTSFKNLCDGFLSARIDSGKAYVKGYEIEKLGRTTVDIPKSRETSFVDNNISITSIGSYFVIDSLIAITDLQKIETIELHKTRVVPDAGSPNTKIGTAKLISIQNGEISGQYRAYITDIKIDDDVQVYEAKSLYSPSSPEFSANIVLTEVALTGSVSNGSGNSLLGTGTRWKSDLAEQLKANDYIRIGNSQKYLKVLENPTDDTNLRLSESPGTVSGQTIYYTYATLNVDEPSGLLFNFPHQYVSTIRTKNSDGTPSENINISYTIPTFVRGNQPGNYHSVVSGTCTVSFPGTQSSGDRFDLVSNNYKVISSDGKWYSIGSGSSAPVSDDVVNISFETGSSTGAIILKFNTSSAPTLIHVIAPIVRFNRKERKKILTTGSVVVDKAENSEINLNKYDVLRITKIVTSADENTEPEANPATDKRIEALYVLDNGQRDFYYDKAKVTLRPGYEKPAGKVLVEFEYFNHSSAEEGDYFSVDSYVGFLNGGVFSPGVSYGEMPNYTSAEGEAYALTDCLDFRKTLDDGLGTSPIQKIQCDYHFYKARNDKIILSSKTKNFELSLGAPDLNPQSALDFNDGMTICELFHKPYGITRESCLLKYLNNRRYTMRDIGKLENRIKNLEYYTSLNLLEKETSDLIITDANGNNRFKNGFLVDNFSSFDSGDSDSSDFLCSIDTKKEKVARPFINDDYVELCETFDSKVGIVAPAAADLARKSVGHYQHSKNIYTLPYDRKIFIGQPVATKVINVNPYEIHSYVGEIRLEPWSDSWRETKVLEPILVQDNTAYNQALSKINGQVDYNKPIEIFSSTVVSGAPTQMEGYRNQKILVAGHGMMEALQRRDRKAYEKARTTGKFTVPPPYINAGEVVSVGRETQFRTRTVQNTTVTTKTIRTGLQQSILDLGISEQKSLTKNELSQIEFIRSREIQFSGTSFMPNSNLYAFFDNISVAEDCRPIVDGEEGWSTHTIHDVFALSRLNSTLVSGLVKVLPVESKTKIFKIKNGTTKFAINRLSGRTDDVGVVRPGCEVVYKTKNNIIKKFEVVSVSSTGDSITCAQKDDLGLIKEFADGLEPADLNNRDNQEAGYMIEISKHTFGDQLKSDGAGRVKGAFKIPNREAKRFKTGDVTFVLTSSNINSANAGGQTAGSARYTARGILDTKQYTITQTRQFSVTTNILPPDIEELRTPGEPIYDFGPIERRDPIAQTFLVRDQGGCFITDVEVFFANKPKNGQILLELREVDESGPLAKIVGGDLGKVSAKRNEDIVVNKVTYGGQQNNITGASNNYLEILVDEKADIEEIGATLSDSTNIVWNEATKIKSESILNGGISNDGLEVTANKKYVNSTIMSELMIPTRFTFDAPIYLEEGKQYAIVLLSDSTEYEVWVAQSGPVGQTLDVNIAGTQNSYGYYNKLGEPNVKIGTTTAVNGQVLYNDGNFYKSNNGYAWDEDFSISMKFNLLKAKFDIKQDAEINFINQELPEVTLIFGAIEAKAGDRKLRVSVPNHGFALGDKIKLIVNSEDSDLLGIGRVAFEEPLSIIKTDIDQFVVQLPESNSPTASGRLGGEISARINKRFEQSILSTNVFIPKSDTKISYFIQTTPTIGVHQNDTPNISNTKGAELEILPGVPVEYDSSMKINSFVNEITTLSLAAVRTAKEQQDILLSRKSIVLKAKLSSTNENLSPILDASRVGLAIISTRLNNPSGLEDAENPNRLINEIFDDVVILDGVKIGSTQNNISENLKVSASNMVLTGKVQQNENSKVITVSPIGTETIDIRKELNLGDKVMDASNPNSAQIRIVEKILSATQFVVNAPFNPSLQTVLNVPARLYISAKNMVITTTNLSLAQSLSAIDIGKYVSLSLSNASTPTLISDTTITFADKLILDVEYNPNATGITPKASITVEHINTGSDGTVADICFLRNPEDIKVTLTQKDNFIDELAPVGGSAKTKYISKNLRVDSPSNAIFVSFDAVRDSSCEIVLYYRTDLSSDSIFEKNWTKTNFNIESGGSLIDKTPEPDATTYVEYQSTLNNLPLFTNAQIKIVMLGGNPAKPPKIKNFRLIVLDE